MQCPKASPCPQPKPCNQKCPKCRTPCVSASRLLRDGDSKTLFVSAPKDMVACLEDDEAVTQQVWCGMEPPRISDPTPAVCPKRLERVRNLLSTPRPDEALATRIESTISLEIMGDGMVKRTHSRKEVKWYQRTGLEMDVDDDVQKGCLPDCTKVSEETVKELFRKSNCQTIPTFSSKRCG